MLKKLTTYDFRFIIRKSLIVYYIITLSLALLTRILAVFDDVMIVDIIEKICRGATVSLIFTTIINNVIHCWVRFGLNLFSDESYLTHTLPVKRQMHYTSKFIVAIVSLICSFIVGILAAIIAFISKGDFDFLIHMLSDLAEQVGGNAFWLTAAIIYVVFLELLNMIQCGYLGILIGHCFNSAKKGLSILFGFVAYLASQLIAMISIVSVAACIDVTSLEIFTQKTPSDIEIVNVLFLSGASGYTFVVLVGYFVGKKLLGKGVNIN